MPIPGRGERLPEGKGSTGGTRPRGGVSAPRWVRYGRGTAIVFEFTGTVAAGVILGYMLDGRFDSEPWLTIVLTLAGVVGGFIRLVQVVKKLEQGRE